MADPQESELAGLVDHFAAEGNWAMAISMARWCSAGTRRVSPPTRRATRRWWSGPGPGSTG
ncbi:hypothetical protein [Micromonospora sp. NBC_01796]|uniref:hypothetical protein n=1 Tax=Micromonospora sp. NBC_01796 TaxID=2975987 RepID=UPI002DDB5366|nr:hypothetical protein [Micromonospora sp. NBC_01796]WSA84272.1 hypothetical protein OIE47_28515 [Micromonospora sp. NBC_01796]